MSLAKLQEALGYSFKRLDLLEQALTHRSLPHKNSYERLEYLGDSILNSIVSRWLFARSSVPEGLLSQQRAILVCEAALCKYAQIFHLANYIQASPELKSRPSIIADCFESLCGAIFLDSSWETLALWLENHLVSHFESTLKDSEIKDYKSQLQEYTQSHKKDLPIYSLSKQVGSEHQPLFEITCQYHSHCTIGKGPSKKHAEQQAAKAMLSLLSPPKKGSPS